MSSYTAASDPWSIEPFLRISNTSNAPLAHFISGRMTADIGALMGAEIIIRRSENSGGTTRA
jgi:hypothetical protein